MSAVGGFQDTVKLMGKYPFVYGAVGIQDKMTQETLDEIRRLSHMDKMVAIGEIGLDYYWHKEEEEHQIHSILKTAYRLEKNVTADVRSLRKWESALCRNREFLRRFSTEV